MAGITAASSLQPGFNVHDIEPTALYKEQTKLVRKVRQKERKVEKIVANEEMRVASRLKHREWNTTAEDRAEEARNKIQQAADNVKRAYVFQVDHAIADADQRRAEHIFRKLKRESMLPLWVRKLEEALDVIKSKGHNNHLMWRSSTRALIVQSAAELEQEVLRRESQASFTSTHEAVVPLVIGMSDNSPTKITMTAHETVMNEADAGADVDVDAEENSPTETNTIVEIDVGELKEILKTLQRMALEINVFAANELISTLIVLREHVCSLITIPELTMKSAMSMMPMSTLSQPNSGSADCDSSVDMFGDSITLRGSSGVSAVKTIVPLRSESWTDDIWTLREEMRAETSAANSTILTKSLISRINTLQNNKVSISVDGDYEAKYFATRGVCSRANVPEHTKLIIQLRAAAAGGQFPKALALFKKAFYPPPSSSSWSSPSAATATAQTLTSSFAQDSRITNVSLTWDSHNDAKGVDGQRSIDSVSVMQARRHRPGQKPVTLAEIKLLMIAFKNSLELDFRDAVTTMDLLQRYDIAPDIEIYNLMLSACVRESRWRRCVAILNDMKTIHNLLPNSHSFEILLNCCRHSLDEPSAIYEALRKCGLPPKYEEADDDHDNDEYD